jgi:hypothetical protein
VTSRYLQCCRHFACRPTPSCLGALHSWRSCYLWMTPLPFNESRFQHIWPPSPSSACAWTLLQGCAPRRHRAEWWELWEPISSAHCDYWSESEQKREALPLLCFSHTRDDVYSLCRIRAGAEVLNIAVKDFLLVTLQLISAARLCSVEW